MPQCPGCGVEFAPRTVRQIRCRPECGRTRVGRRADEHEKYPARFVGVDGEGVTHSDGRHEYVLLSVGEMSLHRDGRQLGLEEIFAFLYECFEHDPDAVYVGYFLGYDYGQWFRMLPENVACSLLTDKGIAARRRDPGRSKNPTPFPVWWHGWEFDIHAARRFRLRPRKSLEDRGHRWMYVNDVGQFYQKSLLAAVDPDAWPKGQEIVSAEEYAVLQAGKDGRSSARFGDDMIRYNTLENIVLARLVGTMERGLTHCKVHLNRRQWYGPGQAAQAWMDVIKAPTARAVRAAVPEEVLLWALWSLIGGWFELFAHGPIRGESYEYDLVSAYPDVIQRLPCLLHGKWHEGRGKIPASCHDEGVTLVRARVEGRDDVVGAMLHRNRDGSIVRPRVSRGTFWLTELTAARRAGVVSRVVTEAWKTYDPCGCPPPLREIAGLFETRQAVGKKTPHGMALRIVMNSAFGKLAQSLGQPRYANPVYASLILATCRARVLDAIATHPTKTESLLMTATDAVFFAEPHPTLVSDTPGLGGWEQRIRENLSLFMPGVYWDDASRERVRVGAAMEVKSRGVSARDLAKVISKVDKMWEIHNPRIHPDTVGWPGWPTVVIPVAFSIVSPRQALARGKWHTAGTIVAEADRRKVLSSAPHRKRAVGWDDRDKPYITSSPLERGIDPADGAYAGNITSSPYQKSVGTDLDVMKMLSELMTPDGPADMLLTEELL